MLPVFCLDCAFTYVSIFTTAGLDFSNKAARLSGLSATKELVELFAPVVVDADKLLPPLLPCVATVSFWVNQFWRSAVYIKPPTTNTPTRKDRNIALKEVLCCSRTLKFDFETACVFE